MRTDKQQFTAPLRGKFHLERLNLTLTYENEMELVFLEIAEEDLSILDIFRMDPGVSKIDRNDPKTIFPSFLVIRSAYTEVMVMVHQPVITAEAEFAMDKITEFSRARGWRISFIVPERTVASTDSFADKYKNAGAE